MDLKTAIKILDINKHFYDLKTVKSKFISKAFKLNFEISFSNIQNNQEVTIKMEELLKAYKFLKNSIEDKIIIADNKKLNSEEDETDHLFPEKEKLNSSNVKWIYYIEDLKLLIVKFYSSSHGFLYQNVPSNIYSQFLKADSPGKFVNTTLRKYAYIDEAYVEDWKKVLEFLKQNL